MSQQDWIERAKKVLPGGGFGNFDPGIIIREGKGSRVWDEDGREYLDLLNSSGPLVLGHGNEEVLDAVRGQLTRGTNFFATNAAGIELAEVICDALACADQLRFVSTGGEADMYVIRLARAFTGRDKILKFEGGYHGMCAEAQMSLAPTKLANFPQPVPDSAGIPQSVMDDVYIAPFNDIDFLRSFLAEHGQEIAGLIAEPFQRVIPPEPGFLEAVKEECEKYGIVLIFDEIVTGFRFDYGGAQALYGVTPHLCSLGKIIGGGFPLAAFAGRADIMSHVDVGSVAQGRSLMHSGTLSGNPVAAVAGLKTLEIMRRDGQYDKLRSIGRQLQEAFVEPLAEKGIDHRVVGDPTLFDVVFTNRDVRNYRDVLSANAGLYKTFNEHLRANGIFRPPGKCYPSLAMSETDIAFAKQAIRDAVQTI